MNAKQTRRASTKEVLAFCNKVRVTLGRKPVDRMRKGSYYSHDCPIANTINYGRRSGKAVSVRSSGVLSGVLPSEGDHPFPKSITTWVKDFDQTYWTDKTETWGAQRPTPSQLKLREKFHAEDKEGGWA